MEEIVRSQVNAGPDKRTLNSLQSGIIRLLLYFDIFDYPLNIDEMRTFIGAPDPGASIDETLDALRNSNYLTSVDGYFGFQNLNTNIQSRKENEQRAKAAMPKAIKRAKLINRFPFVRGVAVSGSVSKGVMREDGDVDFFILTRPGRLWFCRSLLIVYKKLFLLNSHKYFCLNYFLDTDHLEIEEKNVFTATEIVTLLPMVNKELFNKFKECNDWVCSFFPGYTNKSYEKDSYGDTGIKKFIEKLFSGILGEIPERIFFYITLSRWRKKFDKMDRDNFEVAMKSKDYVSKHHPSQFQSRVVLRFEEKIADFENKYNVILQA